MSSQVLVLLPLGALLAGVVLQLLLGRLLTPHQQGWLAFLAALAALGGVAAAWPAVSAGRLVESSFGRWDGPIQLAYRIDGLSFLFALMGSGIGTAVLLYATTYMEHERGTTRFYALMLTFVGGLIHLVYTADLFLLYLSWEAVGVCSFLLVGFWYRKTEAAYGARKVLTMTHLTGYGLLAAVVLIYARTGSTLWTDPKVQASLTTGLFLFILVAALAKSVQFPVHTWIPDAMAAPTPVSALLHAACYVKAGVYLVARLHTFGPWPAAWSLTLAWAGAATLLIGALLALAQQDLKRLLAFSTVSQIGYMMLGLGIGTPLGIAAGLLHCLNHGLFKGGLFLCAGAVQHATGTRDMDRLGGLARAMPHTAALWFVVTGSIMGVPLLNGFVSKWLLYNAALAAGQPLLALVPWVGSIITVFMLLKATSGVFLGSEGPASGQAHEASWPMLAGIGILAGGCILLGVAPQLGIAHLVNPALSAVGCAPLTGIGWFGIMTGQGTWLATGGLLLGLAAMAAGTLVYRLSQPARGLAAAGAAAVFTGGEPLGPGGRLGASDFSRIVSGGIAPFYRGVDSDRLYLFLWRALGRLAAACHDLARWAEARAVLLLVALSLVLGAAAWLVPAAAPAVLPAEPVLPAVFPGGVALAFAGLLLACLQAPRTRPLALPFAVSGALALAGLAFAHGLPRAVLLEASAVAALLMMRKHAAAKAYLAAVALSALGTVGGAWAVEEGHRGLALALLLPGIGIKLGLVPLSLWLPAAAEEVPAVLAGLVIGVVDVAAFAEVLVLRGSAPWLFAPAWPWLVLGLASTLAGALLALGTRHLKRLLAFSTIADMGMMLTALVAGFSLGWEGAMLGAVVHALAKALLFASLSAPEAEGISLDDARGLAARHPLPAAAFLVGAFAVVGVPPTFGFLAHWRIFGALASAPGLLFPTLGAAMLMVAVYARAIGVFWWGGDSTEPPARISPVLSAALLLLMVVLLAAGILPPWSGRIA